MPRKANSDDSEDEDDNMAYEKEKAAFRAASVAQSLREEKERRQVPKHRNPYSKELLNPERYVIDDHYSRRAANSSIPLWRDEERKRLQEWYDEVEKNGSDEEKLEVINHKIFLLSQLSDRMYFENDYYKDDKQDERNSTRADAEKEKSKLLAEKAELEEMIKRGNTVSMNKRRRRGGSRLKKHRKTLKKSNKKKSNKKKSYKKKY